MCSGFEADSYLRLINFVDHSTLGLRVIKKRRRRSTCVEADDSQYKQQNDPPKSGRFAVRKHPS